MRSTLYRIANGARATVRGTEAAAALEVAEGAQRFLMSEREARHRSAILRIVASEVLDVRSVDPFGGKCPFFRGDDCPFAGDAGAHGQAIACTHYRQLPTVIEQRMRDVVANAPPFPAAASRASRLSLVLAAGEQRTAANAIDVERHRARRDGNHRAVTMATAVGASGSTPPTDGTAFADGDGGDGLEFEAEAERNDPSIPIFVRDVKHFRLLMNGLDSDVRASNNLRSGDDLHRLLGKRHTPSSACQ